MVVARGPGLGPEMGPELRGARDAMLQPSSLSQLQRLLLSLLLPQYPAALHAKQLQYLRPSREAMRPTMRLPTRTTTVPSLLLPTTGTMRTASTGI